MDPAKLADDDVSIDELRQAVEHLHGVPAKFIEAVEVDKRFNGEVVWTPTKPLPTRGEVNSVPILAGLRPGGSLMVGDRQEAAAN